MTGVGQAALITAGAAAATFAVDHALKAVVDRSLDEGAHVRGPLGTRIIRRTNDEHAGAGPLLAGGALAAGIATAGALLGRSPVVSAGAGIVAGAMAANLVDRAAGGGVTDFLPTPFGVLNGADVALGAGLVLAGIGLVLR